jgi:hypothetical protein
MSTPHSPGSPESSPFDPFLIDFLREVRGFETGYSPNTNGKAVAERLHVEQAFIEMLTTSARRRRLIEAFYAPAHRNTLRWRLSSRGQTFLSEYDASSTAAVDQSRTE